ncbi:MAG: porin [Gemmatimonadota bacterium]|nr:porin [Gemmatimonadota bacterium]
MSDPVTVTTDALELELGGRLHTQLNTTSVDGEPASRLLIRRARVELGVQLPNGISGAIQPEFGNGGVSLKDAYVEMEVSPTLALRAGSTYRPFGLLEQTSSKRILPVERGLRVRGLAAWDEYAVLNSLDYSDRDVGLVLLGAPSEDVDVTAGVFRGPLHGQVGANSSYQYVARVRGRTAEDLWIGTAWSSRHFVVGAGPELERGHAFEIDLEYGSFTPGWHALAEVAFGDADQVADANFHGGHAWIAYRTEPSEGRGVMLEPLLRLSHADVGIGQQPLTPPGGTLLTPGVAVYFGPANRIAVNYDLWWGGRDSEDASSFKVMFQMGF